MCPSREQIERLLRAENESAELKEFRAHAQNCPRCQTEAARAAEQVLVGKVALEGGHLEAITLSHYLDDDLPSHVRTLLDIHLEACGYCRDRLEAMRAGRQHAAAQPVRTFSFQPVVTTPQPLKWRPARGVAAAALAVTAAVVGLTLLARKQSSSVPLDQRLLAALAAGTVQSLSDLHPYARQLLDAKMHRGTLAEISPPPVPRTLSGQPEEDSDPPLLNPQPDEVLLEPQVNLRWKARKPPYQVEVYTKEGEPVWSRQVSTSSATVPLDDGKTYSVTVTDADDDPFVASVPFSVMNRSEAEQLQQLVRQYPDSHLLRGILYERRNLYTKALKEYKTLSQKNPDSAEARKVYQHWKQELEKVKGPGG